MITRGRALGVSALLLACWSWAAGATGQGGWNASRPGVTLAHRGQTVNSDSLAPTPTQGVGSDNTITSVYWRYQVNGAMEPGLRVKLCTVQRCANIEGGSGRTEVFNGLPASSEFRFVYYLEGRGRIIRPITIQQVEIAVNYQ